ncbi:MAG: FAD-binding oxidoreductase [Bradymonadia bacterium]
MTEASTELYRGLVGALSDAQVCLGEATKRAYARDLWPQMQLDRLCGDELTPPQYVAYPNDVASVARVIDVCRNQRVPIVPFGAGSGVCGGTVPAKGSVVLDLKGLRRIRALDTTKRIVEVEAGYNGERFERWLNRRDLSLGHFPSSILCSTVGGWVATRSAGQCSSRYGKIEDMVESLEVVTADGLVRKTPSQIDGLDWNQVFIGSEGTLGVITAATLRLHQFPAARHFRAWLMPDIQSGLGFFRDAMIGGLRPAVLRMYDPLDTRMVGADPNESMNGLSGRLRGLLSGPSRGGTSKKGALRFALGQARLSNAFVRAWRGPVLAITVSEGSIEESRMTADSLAHIAREHGGEDQGEGPARAWMNHRYDVSFKQSKLYRAGCFVDTFEVATTWENVYQVYDTVRRAMAPYVVVMAHFSHVYPGGCSIYFTMAGSAPSVEKIRTKYRAAWHAGLDAALQAGAAIAHHHGVGLSRMSHMAAANGSAVDVFSALKSTLDPVGIMNPGKVMR